MRSITNEIIQNPDILLNIVKYGLIPKQPYRGHSVRGRTSIIWAYTKDYARIWTNVNKMGWSGYASVNITDGGCIAVSVLHGYNKMKCSQNDLEILVSLYDQHILSDDIILTYITPYLISI
jgi:hypothetical protein